MGLPSARLEANQEKHSIRVIDVLEMQNPEYVPRKCLKNFTKNKDFVRISLEHIRPLKGFDAGNIYAMYEDLLTMKMPRESIDLKRISELQAEKVVVTRESDMYLTGQNWFSPTVEKCINTTVTNLRETLKSSSQKKYKMVHEHSIQLKKLKREVKDKATSKVKADWAVMDPDKTKADVPGDSKKHTVFKPHLLDSLSERYGDIDFEKNSDLVSIDFRTLIWALKQTGTYSWLSESRYSFVFTPETSTILRFFLVKRDEFPTNTVLGVEYTWFPYSNHGPGKLTLNKIIWTSTMMIENDRHRNIVPEDEMLDLDLWYRNTVNGKPYYIHHLSEAVRDKIPPGQVKDLTEAEIDIRSKLLNRLTRWFLRRQIERKKASIPYSVKPRRMSLIQKTRPGRSSTRRQRERRASLTGPRTDRAGRCPESSGSKSTDDSGFEGGDEQENEVSS